MLKNICSSFFMKFLISFLNEKRKLDLFKYNKDFQAKFDINLINYREYSGKYRIFEKNGILKEYDSYTDALLFKGTYLNSKKNGKGKEYYGRENRKYIGEYLNDKKNGKGKEYYLYLLEFEGEYLNGKKWTGKGYHDGEIVYEINNGKGYIKEYNENNGLEYEGGYLNKRRNGKGKEYNKNNKLIYEGEFLNGKKNKVKNIIIMVH